LKAKKWDKNFFIFKNEPKKLLKIKAIAKKRTGKTAKRTGKLSVEVVENTQSQ